MIEHNVNGPFARASWGARPEGQTETVYATRITFLDGREPVYWNADAARPSDERVSSATRSARGVYGHGVNVTVVSRQVTIAATEWEEA